MEENNERKRAAFEKFIETLGQLDEFVKQEKVPQDKSEEHALYIMDYYGIPYNEDTLNLLAHAISRANQISTGISNQAKANYYNVLLIWTAQTQPDKSIAVWYAFLLGVIFNELFGNEEPL